MDKKGKRVTSECNFHSSKYLEKGKFLCLCIVYNHSIGRSPPFKGPEVKYHHFVTLGPTYYEFGYNERPVTVSRFLYIKLIDCNVRRHPLIMSSFFCIFLLIVSGTQCNFFSGRPTQFYDQGSFGYHQLTL